MAKDLRPIYTAVNAEQAVDRLNDFTDKSSRICPAAVKLWRNAWAEFILILDYDVDPRDQLHHQRDRVTQRALAACGACPEPLPTTIRPR